MSSLWLKVFEKHDEQNWNDSRKLCLLLKFLDEKKDKEYDTQKTSDDFQNYLGDYN